ncbi:MAG: lysine biosynthesis protein LysW [Acidiferrobacterales bacterium]|nr:lysine biosynthesis protein LysW [Acidiferrobacterales bacterium]
MAECPVCALAIEFEQDTITGELIECDDCGAELEVVSIDPDAVAEAPETDEDWGQ